MPPRQQLALFTCLDIGPETKEKIVEWAQTQCGPDRKFEKIICDHVTTLFLPSCRTPADKEFKKQVSALHQRRKGEIVQIRPLALHISPTLVALEVNLPEDILCANAHPHITIMLSEPSKPKDSNDLIASPPDPEHHIVIPYEAVACSGSPSPSLGMIPAIISWSPEGSSLPH